MDLLNYYRDFQPSERIEYKPVTSDLAAQWTDFIKDEAVTRFFPLNDQLTLIEQSENWILKQLNRYKDNQYGLLAMYLKDSKEFIGMSGLLTQQIEDSTELEVGYHLLPSFRGKGYAAEAASHFMKKAEKIDGFHSVVSIIDIHNIASIRVALKNGLIKEKELVWSGIPVFIYRKKFNSK